MFAFLKQTNMQDKTINESESLHVIQQMIQAAKNKISEDGFMYLLWGWLVLAASLVQFVLIQMHNETIPWVG
jgi:hypothetical protein